MTVSLTRGGRRRERARSGTVQGRAHATVLALSVMRVGLFGATSYLAPARAARLLDPHVRTESPAIRYLVRLYGARAVGLGLSYLLSDGGARRRAQRLALLVDTADTVMTPLCGLPRNAARRSMAITGTYAALGAWALWVTRGDADV